MSVDLFKEWPDDERLALAKKVAPYLAHHGAELFLVGKDPKTPYRNEIRAGWKTKKTKLLGIIKPVSDGLELELRVGSEVGKSLIEQHTCITATKDGSSNKDDKIIVHLSGTEPHDELKHWVSKAYLFTIGKTLPN